MAAIRDASRHSAQLRLSREQRACMRTHMRTRLRTRAGAERRECLRAHARAFTAGYFRGCDVRVPPVSITTTQ